MSNMKGIYIGCMLLCIAAVSSAQTYDVIERRNSWNAGTNVTGIMMDSVTVSYAELYWQKLHYLLSFQKISFLDMEDFPLQH